MPAFGIVIVTLRSLLKSNKHEKLQTESRMLDPMAKRIGDEQKIKTTQKPLS